VLWNLLGYAVKFTPEGGRIEVSARPRGDRVEVSVSDNGPGLSPEQVARVFERYWQAEATKRLGTGLGLTIAKGIVEAHGGSVWVESRLGEGASFYFTVPLAAAARAA
jgi:signal transduction histidine kinase